MKNKLKVALGSLVGVLMVSGCSIDFNDDKKEQTENSYEGTYKFEYILDNSIDEVFYTCPKDPTDQSLITPIHTLCKNASSNKVIAETNSITMFGNKVSFKFNEKNEIIINPTNDSNYKDMYTVTNWKFENDRFYSYAGDIEIVYIKESITPENLNKKFIGTYKFEYAMVETESAKDVAYSCPSIDGKLKEACTTYISSNVIVEENRISIKGDSADFKVNEKNQVLISPTNSSEYQGMYTLANWKFENNRFYLSYGDATISFIKQ